MAFAPQVTTPAAFPITLAQVKAQSVIDYADDDVLLDSYIKAAVSYLDGPTGILGRAVMPQTVTQQFDSLEVCMPLPYGSVISVTSVQYYDENGVLQPYTDFTLLKTLAGGDYLHMRGDFPKLEANNPAPIVVTYQAGFTDVPQSILQAINLMVAHWYNQREAAVMTTGSGALNEIPWGVADLVAPLRRVGV